MKQIASGIVICDFGSQYTLLISRKLREIGVFSEVIPGNQDLPPQEIIIKGVILSGGPQNHEEEGAMKAPHWVWELDVPVLGICYGMQLIVQRWNGRFAAAQTREYGKNKLLVLEGKTPSGLFPEDFAASPQVWMSHSDSLEKMPEQFHVLAMSDHGAIAAIAHKDKPYFALQFHPEVYHSIRGIDILHNFCGKICHLNFDWKSEHMFEAVERYVLESVPDNGKVLLGVSGGVDSTVAAVAMGKILGPERLHCVLIDHGLMRKNETHWVSTELEKQGITLTILDRKEFFIQELSGISDSEEKRKIIGRCFVNAFESYAQTLSGVTHLGQGTLYPDVIESAGHGKGSHNIKSHHNVGGLPDRLQLSLVEPFRFLFKDEVRKIGLSLGIDKNLIFRHPFPGPGLAVRIPGALSAEKIIILKEADHIFTSKLHEHDFYDKVWQAATILLPVKSVGIMGDQRTYEWTISLRAVNSVDGMTAEAADLPIKFLAEVASAIVQKVKGVNRVLYDVTSKPPATIEWE